MTQTKYSGLYFLYFQVWNGYSQNLKDQQTQRCLIMQPSNQVTKQPSNIAEVLANIKIEIQKIRDYTPRVGIVGNSGVGKSSLCNALFGAEIAKTSTVASCTREAQEIRIGADNSGNGGMILVDLPGIGETPARQEEYIQLYQEHIPKLDLILWAIKSDDRNYDSAIRGYEAVLKDLNTPRIFVITQLDKIGKSSHWDHETFTPGEKQRLDIVEKEHKVSEIFDISVRHIVSVAVDEEDFSKNYQLKELVERIVEVLPNEKKYAFTREAKAENVTEAARVSAEKGVWDHIKEVAGVVWDEVKDSAVTAVIASAPRAVAAIINRIKMFWW